MGHLIRSTTSRLVIAEDGTHYLHHNEPGVVIEAIQSSSRP